jgi:hypothetical protein
MNQAERGLILSITEPPGVVTRVTSWLPDTRTRRRVARARRTICLYEAAHTVSADGIAARGGRGALGVAQALHAFAARKLARVPQTRTHAFGIAGALDAPFASEIATQHRRRTAHRAGPQALVRRRLADVEHRAIAVRSARHAQVQCRIASTATRVSAMRVGRALDARGRSAIAMQIGEGTIGVDSTPPGIEPSILDYRIRKTKLGIACERQRADEHAGPPFHGERSAIPSASVRAYP